MQVPFLGIASLSADPSFAVVRPVEPEFGESWASIGHVVVEAESLAFDGDRRREQRERTKKKGPPVFSRSERRREKIRRNS
jgi:hypothetical protein